MDKLLFYGWSQVREIIFKLPALTRKDQMLIRLNGKDKEVSNGATLGEAIKGELYQEGTLIALTRPASSIRETAPRSSKW